MEAGKKPFKITGIFVEVDGKKENIKNLPQDQYEYFLDSVNELRLVYITTMNTRAKAIK